MKRIIFWIIKGIIYMIITYSLIGLILWAVNFHREATIKVVFGGPLIWFVVKTLIEDCKRIIE